jgi:branched-chain amino acid transport system permease protein
MILFLIVVSVGGASTITGPFFASILLGVADVMGKYYEGAALPFLHGVEVPRGMGAFTIYIIMVVVLILRPQGLFARSGAR